MDLVSVSGWIAAHGAVGDRPRQHAASLFRLGEVFWSATQTTAMLSSNCPIHIDRQDRIIVMKNARWTVSVVIPIQPGLHEFVYRWGQTVARFDDEKVEVKPGSVETKTGNDF